MCSAAASTGGGSKLKDETKRHNDLEDLIVGHFHGCLNEGQEKELAESLATSAEAQKLFTSHMRLEGRLHSLGRDGFLREPTDQRNALPDKATRRTANHAPIDRGRRRYFQLLTTSISLVATVAVLLSVSIWGLWPSKLNARAVLHEARQAAAEMVDRTYRVVETHPNAEGIPTIRELTITVRGGGRFVVQPENGAYVMGSDGIDYWMVRRNGPVFVTSEFRSLAPELQRQIPNRQLLNGILASPDEPLLLGMSDLLLLIEQRYDIELVDSASSSEHHVQATRRSGSRGRPSIINFYADAKTGVVFKAELIFTNSRRRTFELIETPERSDQWYHHSEHAPSRQVERLDAVD